MFHQRVCWQVLKKRRKEKREKEKEGRARKKNKCSIKKILSHKSPSISFKVLKRSFHQWSIVESDIHPFFFLPLVLFTILTTHSYLDLIV
jgi:hypothetical protein